MLPIYALPATEPSVLMSGVAASLRVPPERVLVDWNEEIGIAAPLAASAVLYMPPTRWLLFPLYGE